MNEVDNPFRPTAGARPPELAGRDDVIRDATIALKRLQTGGHARGQLMLGLRGVGKTVLLNEIETTASGLGFQTVYLEVAEDQRLAAMLTPKLRSVLVRLSGVERAKQAAREGLAVLRSFASAFKVSYLDFEFGIEPAAGTADSGDLESDLPELFLQVGAAAKAAGTGVGIFIDELQYLSEKEFGALIAAIHRVGQKGRPLILFGAGLPQVAGLAGDAKSYAERLFLFPGIGALRPDAARAAIEVPVVDKGAAITPEALARIVELTEGYPYFLQEWGAHAWNAAERSPITVADVERGTGGAVRALDESFFKVRFDRLTAREKDYMRAMADLGAGPHRSKEIADRLGVQITAASPIRDKLIRKGMIYSGERGQTAFTVPMFDAFMRRTMPQWTPGEGATATARTKKASGAKGVSRKGARRRRGG